MKRIVWAILLFPLLGQYTRGSQDGNIAVNDSALVIPVDSEFQGRMRTAADWAALLRNGLSWINEIGFAQTVKAALEGSSAEVKSLLDWTPSEGVLLELRVQVPTVPTPGFNNRMLVGNGAHVVGVGSDPSAVLATYFARGKDLKENPTSGWKISPDDSKYLWITKTPRAYHVGRISYSELTRTGAAVLAQQELSQALSQAEDRRLVLSMADHAARTAVKAQLRTTINSLRKSAAESLQKMDDINSKLKAELEQVSKLEALAATFNQLAQVFTLAAQISMAQSSLGPDTPAEVIQAQSKAELRDAIEQARQRGQDTAAVLQNSRTEVTNQFIIQRNTLVIKLKDAGAPTVYLRPTD